MATSMPPNAWHKRFPQPSESEARVLSVVLRQRSLTQPVIARETGLSQQSISRIVTELSRRGALRAGERQALGRRGQPSVAVELEPTYAYSMGVALMTDAMSVLLMDFSGAVVDYAHIEMPAMTRRAVFDRLARLEEKFLTRHRIDRSRLFGTGVGISGYCLGGGSRYNTPRALDDWALVDLVPLFTEALGRPAWVENDGNAAAIGESLLGIGRTCNNFVYLFLAAGIGGGVIVDHRLLRGRHGNGGEIGLILPQQVYPHPSMESLRQSITQHGVQVDGLSDMLARFDVEWPGVQEWIMRTRDSFSLIVSSIAALLDPDAVVIGGRIPAALTARVIPHIEIYDDIRRAEPRPLPSIGPSQTSEDASAIGAAALAFEKHFFAPAP
jgi:predicted NBD/HSP70 family sugar kinase